MPDAELTPAQEAFRKSWGYRAIVRTNGRETMLGAIVLAVLGSGKGLPRFDNGAVIDKDGIVWAGSFTNRWGSEFAPFAIGPVSRLLDQLKLLADEIKLDDADRATMFQDVQKWIKADGRALALDELSEVKGKG